MHKLKILIVEDEFIIAEDIRAAVSAAEYPIFGIARSYAQAIELLKKDRPDFALLDITLNGDQSGLELGRMFYEELNIPYIYVTSHSDTGTLEKVKLTHPSGYLLKPFKRESIYTAIEVALLNFNNKTDVRRESDKFMIRRKGEEKIKVRYSEILFMESDGNYTHVHTVFSKFTERKTLKTLLDEMEDHPFVRIHKSFAVHKDKIYHYTREKIFIGGHEIPVGRTYIEALGL